MGYVYVIGMEGTSLVKIGSTKRDPARRLQALQVGVPYRLSLLKVFPCEQEQQVEFRLHDMLHGQHSRGEWFDVALGAIDRAFQQAAQGPTKEEYGHSLAQRLQRLRLAKGLSRRQLAIQAGIPQGIISRLEREEQDYPSVPVAMRLAKVLGVSVDFLIGMYEETADSERTPTEEDAA